MTWHLENQKLEKQLIKSFPDFVQLLNAAMSKRAEDEIDVTISLKTKGSVYGNLYFPICELKDIKDYNPNGWNDQKITPPRFAHFRYSQPYLVETSKSHFVEGVFDFDSRTWHENCNNCLVDCTRYREMPVGFFGE